MNEVYSYRSSSYHTQKLYRDGDTVYDIELNLTGSLKLVLTSDKTICSPVRS